MRKFIALMIVLMSIFQVSVASARTASATYFGESEYLRYNTKFQNLITSLMEREQVILIPYEVAASDTLSVSGIYSYVFLTKTSGNSTSTVTLGTSSATNGQVMYLFNDSATTTSILSGSTCVATASADGGVAHLLYASASWRLLEDQ